MDINRDKIVLTRYPLMGFAGERVFPIGSIELPVIVGEHPRQKNIMVKFLLIDPPSAYNTILGRTALNELKAITSTSDLCVLVIVIMVCSGFDFLVYPLFGYHENGRKPEL